MSSLHEIEQRHRSDRTRDILFVAGALLLAALSLGAMTGQVAGRGHKRTWSVTVTESAPEVMVAANGP